jgi:hypothetical protein
VEKRLISDARLLGKPVIVSEIHPHSGEVHHRPGTPRFELQEMHFHTAKADYSDLH